MFSEFEKKSYNTTIRNSNIEITVTKSALSQSVFIDKIVNGMQDEEIEIYGEDMLENLYFLLGKLLKK